MNEWPDQIGWCGLRLCCVLDCMRALMRPTLNCFAFRFVCPKEARAPGVHVWECVVRGPSHLPAVIDTELVHGDLCSRKIG